MCILWPNYTRLINSSNGLDCSFGKDFHGFLSIYKSRCKHYGNVARCQAGTRMTWSISHHHTLLRISMDILIPYHSGTAVTRSKQTLRAITWCLQMKHVPKSSKITYNISYLIFWGWIPNHIYQDPRATLPCFPSFQTRFAAESSPDEGKLR